MRRRSGAGPDQAKSCRRKTVTQKRRGLRNPSAADHETQSDLVRLTRERDEALEREKATAEVLHVISSSRGELETVFNAVVENATRLCEAAYGNLFLRDGDAFRLAALHGDFGALEYHKGALFQPAAGVPLARIAETRQPVHVADYRLERGFWGLQAAARWR
jgi:two-component system NtrC family sensor kinase